MVKHRIDCDAANRDKHPHRPEPAYDALMLFESPLQCVSYSDNYERAHQSCKYDMRYQNRKVYRSRPIMMWIRYGADTVVVNQVSRQEQSRRNQCGYHELAVCYAATALDVDVSKRQKDRTNCVKGGIN